MEQIYETLIFIGIVFLLAFLGWLGMNRSFKKASQEKCFFCCKELGKDYYNDKCSYKEEINTEEIWAHTKCIPQKELKEWERTQ